MTKTVAFIRSSGFFSDSRSTKEIRTLVGAGYKVIAIGWDRKGIAKEKCNAVFADISDSVSFKLMDLSTQSGSGIKSIVKFVKWFRYVRKVLLQYKDRINIIHACDFDAAYPAYHFFRKHSVKMVYDIYDYYIDSHSIPLILSRVIEKSENRIINTADCVILCTEERREQIRKTSPKKVIVVHNSPDVEIIPNSEELYDYSYCGALVDRRLISEIVDDYQNNQDFKIAIAGGGKHLQKVQQLKARFCNVSYLGVIPYDEVISIEAKTKVLSAMYEPVIRNHKLCAPNKFYEAMALGKPIIVCRGTGIDKIVEDNRIGVAINYNACEFYTELRRLINNPQLRKSMGENARNLYERDYKWTVMKQRLIAMYDEL